MFDTLALDLFDTVGVAGVTGVDDEGEVNARVLAADAAARERAWSGLDEPWSVAAVLREQAFAGEQLTRRAQARSLRAVAGLVAELRVEDTARAGTRGGRVGEFVADQVAAVLGVSRRSAELRVEEALALTDRLPKTLVALEAGFLSASVAHVLVRETENTAPAVAGEVEARVLDRLGRGVLDGLGRLAVEEIGFAAQLQPDRVAAIAVRATAGQVRALARRALAALDAEAVKAQRDRARADRDVDLIPGRPGITWVGAPLAEADAAAVYERLDRSARDLACGPEETRTVGQLRADVFRDLLLSTGGLEGALAGVRAAVQLQVTLDHSGGVTCDRVGAVSPEGLADLLALAAGTGGAVKVTQVREQTCPGAHPDLDVVPDRYRPSPVLVAAVIARDVTCRFPGCTVPAAACDLDHVIAHPAGPTCICNLCALCRHHHRLKTHGGWTLTHHGDGHLTWRDPTGHTHDVWPDWLDDP